MFALGDYYGCCTINIITGFGQTLTAEYGLDAEFTLDQLREEIRVKCRAAKIVGKAIVTAATNNEQVIANEALELEGFSSSPWCSKTQHPETQVKLWFKPLQEV